MDEKRIKDANVNLKRRVRALIYIYERDLNKGLPLSELRTKNYEKAKKELEEILKIFPDKAKYKTREEYLEANRERARQRARRLKEQKEKEKATAQPVSE